MDWKNRIGLYGGYFLGVGGIGFTLPYLTLFLLDRGLSNRAVGILSMLAALAGLIQFPLGLWSDRLGRRKPLLVAALAVMAVATGLLYGATDPIWLGVLVVLMAENGACRATVESLAGAEAAHLAAPGGVGGALAALRFWKPVSIVCVALTGGVIAEVGGVADILPPLAVLQGLAVVAALLIREKARGHTGATGRPEQERAEDCVSSRGLRDGAAWAFVAAMVLFHTANSPGGVFLAPFLRDELGASNRTLSYAFVVSMFTWMLVVLPAGRWADRLGRKPLLIVAWAGMTLRLALTGVVQVPWQVLLVQVLDGLANGLFAVVAAAWMTDRLADPRRVGEAQVLVGSALVAGSALGPLLAGLVLDGLGYRGLFWLLAALGAAATLLVSGVPETVGAPREVGGPMALVTDLADTP